MCTLRKGLRIEDTLCLVNGGNRWSWARSWEALQSSMSLAKTWPRGTTKKQPWKSIVCPLAPTNIARYQTVVPLGELEQKASNLQQKYSFSGEFWTIVFCHSIVTSLFISLRSLIFYKIIILKYLHFKIITEVILKIPCVSK